MSKVKKMFAILLALCLLTVCLPLSASAGGGPSRQGTRYPVDGGFLRVDSNGEITYQEESNITSLVIPEKVGSVTVKTLTLTNFELWKNLTSITIPKSVTSIDYGFAGWQPPALETITVDGNNPNYSSVDGVLFNKDKTVLVKYPPAKGGSYTVPDTVTTISNYAFADCENLTSVTIPDTVSTIDWGAFLGCTSLSSVKLPEGLTEIRPTLFESCSSLASIDLSSSIKSIGDSAFSGCSSLTALIVPEGVTYIGSNAFSSCSSLRSVSLPASLKTLHEYDFYECTSLEAINVAAGNEEYSSDGGVLFGKRWVDDDKGILMRYPSNKIGNSYTMPDDVEIVYQNAFRDCANLSKVTLSKNQTYQEHYTNGLSFLGCSRLSEIDAGSNPNFTSVDGVLFNADQSVLMRYPSNKTGTTYAVPGTVTKIDDYAFMECTGLTSVVFPQSVKEIGDSAFRGCSSLVSLALPEGLETLAWGTFENCSSLTTVSLPSTLVSGLGSDNFNGCFSLTSIDVSEDNPEYCSVDGALFSKDKTIFHYYPAGKKDTTFTIPEGITYLHGMDGLNENKFLENLVLPSSLEDGALWLYSHLNLSIDPKNAYLTVKDGAIFSKDLKTLVSCNYKQTGPYTIPTGVTKIEEDAFGNNTSLSSITIPEGVSEIRRSSFGGCDSLSTVTLPESLTKIWDSAFGGCTSLTKVYYGGSKEEWEKLDLPWGNVALLNATVHFAKESPTNPTPSTPSIPSLPEEPDEQVDPVEPEIPAFTDVPENEYYSDAVTWAVAKGITVGTSETTFSPNADCTRGQIVTFLWRAAGSQEPTSSNNPFVDIKPSDYFYDAVLWATENGITYGTSDTTFSPDDPCTRGQSVTLLWRAESNPAVSSAVPDFIDVSNDQYYTDAVAWAVENDITKGTGDNKFSPEDTCTRGQIVTFLYRDMGE